MINKLIKNATKYLMESEYKRIKEGNRIGINNVPYSLNLYDNIIKFFESNEDYEKCLEVLNIKNKILDHDSNFIKK